MKHVSGFNTILCDRLGPPPQVAECEACHMPFDHNDAWCCPFCGCPADANTCDECGRIMEHGARCSCTDPRCEACGRRFHGAYSDRFCPVCDEKGGAA